MSKNLYVLILLVSWNFLGASYGVEWTLEAEEGRARMFGCKTPSKCLHPSRDSFGSANFDSPSSPGGLSRSCATEASPPKSMTPPAHMEKNRAWNNLCAQVRTWPVSLDRKNKTFIAQWIQISQQILDDRALHLISREPYTTKWRNLILPLPIGTHPDHIGAYHKKMKFLLGVARDNECGEFGDAALSYTCYRVVLRYYENAGDQEKWIDLFRKCHQWLNSTQFHKEALDLNLEVLKLSLPASIKGEAFMNVVNIVWKVKYHESYEGDMNTYITGLQVADANMPPVEKVDALKSYKKPRHRSDTLKRLQYLHEQDILEEPWWVEDVHEKKRSNFRKL